MNNLTAILDPYYSTSIVIRKHRSKRTAASYPGGARATNSSITAAEVTDEVTDEATNEATDEVTDEVTDGVREDGRAKMVWNHKA